MKYKYVLLFIACSPLWCLSQTKLEIATAEISFVYLNNDVDGTIGGFNSTSTIDFNDLKNSKIQGSADVSTIDTGNSIRNWSLRRGKYFNAEDYPKITFESTSIKRTGKGIQATGQLTIKGTTKEITFDFVQKEQQLIGTTALNSYDYGIKVKKKREANKVDVKIVLQLK